MRTPAVDLVVERLVLDGLNVPPEQAPTLARLVEDELRLLAAAMSDRRNAILVDTHPVALSQPADLPLLARVLAQRIAAEAQRTRMHDGR